MPVFFTPKNDTELNAFIASMRQATDKYFRFAPGASRSNNLKDCICEGIGFTNGAYQQLQDVWRTHHDWQPLSAGESRWIENRHTLPMNMTMVIMSGVAHTLYQRLSADFPCTKLGFADGDNEVEDAGWQLYHGTPEQTMPEQGEAIAAALRERTANPLFYGNRLIGYMADAQAATLVNGMLMGWYMNGTLDNLFAPEQGQGTLNLLNRTLPFTPYQDMTSRLPLMVSLRMASMEHSIMLPADAVYHSAGEMVIRTAQGAMRFAAEEDCVDVYGLLMDFVSVYPANGQAMTLSVGEVTGRGDYEDMTPRCQIESAEWFPQVGMECREVGREPDELTDINFIRNRHATACTPA